MNRKLLIKAKILFKAHLKAYGKLHRVHPVDAAHFRVGPQQYVVAIKDSVTKKKKKKHNNLPKIWHYFPNNVK